jgi:hypothetical protein
MKFCRRCGQPSLDTTSVSEATTRVFEATREPTAAPTQTWNAQPTGPAYIAPGSAQPLQDVNTRSLGPTAAESRKTGKLVLMFALLFAAMLMAFVVGMRLSRRSTVTTGPTVTPPVVTRPGTDLPPPPPPLPPIEQPPSAPGTSAPTSELIYPGAETVTDMRSGRDNFLQLRTGDAPGAVLDWYTNKLKGAQILRTQGGGVLRAGATNVIITPRGSGSEIIIKQGG